MNLVYYLDIYYIINSEPTSTSNEIATLIETIVNIFVGILAVIGGVIAILYFRKLREKRLDASFSFLSRLKVRINCLCEMFEEHSEVVLDRFLPGNKRRVVAPEKSTFIDDIIYMFAERAKETLDFLRNQDDQLPSKRGWTDMMSKFLSFLEDCAKIHNTKYFKWYSVETNDKDNYINSNLINMKKMLDSITEYQKDIEKKICRK